MGENESGSHYRVLGLAIDIDGCGFALIDKGSHEILEMGTHLWDAPQNPQTKVSLASKRRDARSARRNNERTKSRQSHCLSLLKGAGLVPSDAGKGWMQSRKGDRPILELRAAGLDRTLTDRELSQVLYSLSGRRGYIPHGMGDLSDGDGDGDDRKVLSAVVANERELEEGDYRTVGEMLYRKGRSRNKGGDYSLCVHGSLIADEARQVLEAQRRLGNGKATDDLERRYLDCLKWEKRTLDHDERVYEQVGRCVYFPEERRAAKADLSSELCRAYERLGHLLVVREDGTEEALDHRHREGYVGVLFSPCGLRGNKDCKVTYRRIRRDLGLGARDVFKGVDPQDEAKEPFAPKAWRSMRKSGLSESLMVRMLEDHALADGICEALTYASTEESLRMRLDALGLDITDAEVDEICGRVPFNGRAFNGYGTRSRKALDMLVGAFEDESVRTLAEAEEATGLRARRLAKEDAVRGTVLPPYNCCDPGCRNPVVLRAMGRMRRVVNAITRIYGVPDEIHVRVERRLRQSKHEKGEYERRQKQNEKANERCRNLAAGILGCDESEVSEDVVQKISLREEQGCKDVYTDETIDLERLVRDEGYCEFDHILPYARTADDSRRNRVLVLAKSNQDKGERTPYEWMIQDAGRGAPDWEEFKARMLESKGLAYKRRNLLTTDLSRERESWYIGRNLSDRSHMAVAARRYLEDSLLFPEGAREQHVLMVTRGAIAGLRHSWGIEDRRHDKSGSRDERRRATEACVVAACNASAIKRAAELRKVGPETYRHLRRDALADSQPWPTFAREVRELREHVIPTRKVEHGATGGVLHDTLYRFDGIDDSKGQKAILVAKGAPKVSGNYVLEGDGSARMIDGMAFLQLWQDPDARPNGKVKGSWYIDPVYYIDIPAVRNGVYQPRMLRSGIARNAWKTVPVAAQGHAPLILFRGDVFAVNGLLARFVRLGIGSGKLNVVNPADGTELRHFPPVSKWGRASDVHVIEEDVLGHCYQREDVRRMLDATRALVKEGS